MSTSSPSSSTSNSSNPLPPFPPLINTNTNTNTTTTTTTTTTNISRPRHRHPAHPFGHHHNSSISSLAQLSSPPIIPTNHSISPSSPSSSFSSLRPPPIRPSLLPYISTNVSTSSSPLLDDNFDHDDKKLYSLSSSSSSSSWWYTLITSKYHAYTLSTSVWIIICSSLSCIIVLLLLFPTWSYHYQPPTGYIPNPRPHVPGDYFPVILPTSESNDSSSSSSSSSLLFNPNVHLSVKDNVIYPHLSAMDAEWSFVEREPGNFEHVPVGSPSPRPIPLPRKLGLIAIPAGEKAKPLVDRLIRRFGSHDFSYMIFHWDNATWHEFPWYKHIIGIRATGQTKFWFAKRFLTPDVVQNYDYIWLWDDDIEPEPQFNPISFINSLKKFHIHFAQPSLTWGEHGLQGPVVKKRPNINIGRFTTFIEVMMPVISRGAWPCAWRMIPWDTKATWGVDNVWYPACGAYGYCRFAVMDSFPVRHLDTRTFENTMDTNLAELRAYTEPFTALCNSLEDSSRDISTIALPLQVFCRWWNIRDPLFAFDTVRPIESYDAINMTVCPDSVDFPNVRNVPWWHVR